MLDESTLSCAMLYECDVQHDQPVSNVPCDCRRPFAPSRTPPHWQLFPCPSNMNNHSLSAISGCPQRMAWAQDQWEKLAQVSSGAAGPSFDPQQEASDAVQQLLEADVVLTSYEVLRQEVHYSPEGARLHSLRRAKKYVVPESPLLSVRLALLQPVHIAKAAE